jgi:hypothetical protein
MASGDSSDPSRYGLRSRGDARGLRRQAARRAGCLGQEAAPPFPSADLPPSPLQGRTGWPGGNGMHRAPSTTIRMTVLRARSVPPNRPHDPRPAAVLRLDDDLDAPARRDLVRTEESRHAPSLARHYGIERRPDDFGRRRDRLGGLVPSRPARSESTQAQHPDSQSGELAMPMHGAGPGRLHPGPHRHPRAPHRLLITTGGTPLPCFSSTHGITSTGPTAPSVKLLRYDPHRARSEPRYIQRRDRIGGLIDECRQVA